MKVKGTWIEEKWNVAIILDACRYDYFEKHYKKYMNGELKKGRSCAVWTLEWLTKSFTGKYDDIVYISANPFINSIKKISRQGYEFCAKEKFFKVVDVWNFGWSEELKCVMPDEVNKAFLNFKRKYPKKKFILHYMQPHYPYIPLNAKDKNARILHEKDITLRNVERTTSHQILRSILINCFGHVGLFKLRALMNVEPFSQFEYIFKKYGVKEIEKLYEKNLMLVLESVSKILPKINGKIIVTSDHGEMLGEHNMLGHLENMAPKLRRRYK